MRAGMRWFLVVVLVALMPFKALASLGWSCPHGHAMGGAVIGAAHDGRQAHHGHHDPAAHGVAGNLAAADDAVPTETACSHCAPCCAPALPAAAMPQAPAGVPAPLSAAPAAAAHADAALDGLERPPRTRLA